MLIDEFSKSWNEQIFLARILFRGRGERGDLPRLYHRTVLAKYYGMRDITILYTNSWNLIRSLLSS